ncbi:MAG TPA: DNA repair protein RecN [Caldilineae bacterium]|nr:DNA repair protein RecN [Caldilineae bacterium]
MLTELRVRHFAIIDDLHVRFHRGFNVLTGETGAGKSIIIDAIELLLGAKTNQEMVRAGQNLASIEGIFELDDAVGSSIQAELETLGLESEDDFLILARDVRRGGRSVARINGRAVAQSVLASIGGLLVDIHGQGQHLSLLKVREHVNLLDRYAGLEAQRAALAGQVAELQRIRRELEVLRRDAREIARRVDLLAYQVEEIDAAVLEPDEDTNLENERKRLANAEALASQSAAIYGILAEGGAEALPVLDQLGETVARLQKLAQVDAELEAVLTQAQDVFERVNDLARDMGDYNAGISYDPERLAEVEERLDLIFQLKRKYGDTIAEILAFGEAARDELKILSQSETRTAELEAEEDRLLHDIGELGEALSAARRAAGETLARAIEEELADLRMAGTRFAVEIEQRPEPSGCFVSDRRLAFDATGIDKVQFLVSANPGEPLRPLVKVASGGETARLMLALKNVLSRADATPTLIFDEIDQGIGGRVGAIVGRKLGGLAETHQVLCVTHLPQIAAYGDYHLAVSKSMDGERTITRLQALDGEARVQELAAMLGADSEAGRQSARELLAAVSAQPRA